MNEDDLAKLREHRFHLKYVLDNLELKPDVRTIFTGLLQSIEEQISEIERRKKPN
jgi:hypothetical protein